MSDPIEQLRELKPGVDWEWASSPRGQEVMRRAMDLGALEARSLRTRPRRLSRGAIAAAIAGGAAVVTLGAFTYMSTFQVHDPAQSGCYEKLDPMANVTEASDDVIASRGVVEACVQSWRQGHDDPVGRFTPVTCLSADGGRGVFPAPIGMTAEAACASIGWQAERT